MKGLSSVFKHCLSKGFKQKVGSNFKFALKCYKPVSKTDKILFAEVPMNFPVYDWLSLYLFQSPSDPWELEIKPNAYWWFTIVDTTGRREMFRWNVGQHILRGYDVEQIGHKWFVNE